MTVGISRIFRSTDASAPQLYGTSGSLNAVLKAVLINGYGSTLPIGWTLPFDSGNVSVFRPAAGVRPFVRINDGWADPNFADLRAYMTMIDVNNGAEMMPFLALNCLLHKRYSSGASAIPWIIVGDEAGIYLLVKPGYPLYGDTPRGNPWSIYFFGDYVPWDIRNKWNFNIHGMYASDVYGGIGNHADTFGCSLIMRSPATYQKGFVYCGVTGISQVNARSGIENALGLRKLGGSYLTTPVRLYLSNALVVPSMIIGNYPGLFCVMEVDTSSATTSNEDFVYKEVTDYNGNMNLIVTGTAFSLIAYGNYPSKYYLIRAMIRVGRGFRNAY